MLSTTKTDVQKTDVQNLVLYRMAKKVTVTNICYIDPPWNQRNLTPVERQEAMDESTLWRRHAHLVLRWELRWRHYDAQPEHHFLGPDPLARPSPLPPCTCHPWLDPVVYIDDDE